MSELFWKTLAVEGVKAIKAGVHDKLQEIADSPFGKIVRAADAESKTPLFHQPALGCQAKPGDKCDKGCADVRLARFVASIPKVVKE